MNSSPLSVNEVAGHLKVSAKWVYEHKSKLPGYFKIGGMIFFHREQFYAGLERLAAKPEPARAKPDPSRDRHGLL